MSRYDSDVSEFRKRIIKWAESKFADLLYANIYDKFEEVSDVVYSEVKNLPSVLAKKIGEYGMTNSPFEGKSYKSLAKNYIKEKRLYFRNHRNRRSLVGSQSFYSFSGDLFRDLRDSKPSDYVKNLVYFKVSVDGGSSFTPVARGSSMRTIRSRLRRQLAASTKKRVELCFKVGFVSSTSVFRSFLSGDSVRKLEDNDKIRPLFNPFLKYFYETTILPKVNKVVKGTK